MNILFIFDGCFLCTSQWAICTSLGTVWANNPQIWEGLILPKSRFKLCPCTLSGIDGKSSLASSIAIFDCTFRKCCTGSYCAARSARSCTKPHPLGCYPGTGKSGSYSLSQFPPQLGAKALRDAPAIWSWTSTFPQKISPEELRSLLSCNCQAHSLEFWHWTWRILVWFLISALRQARQFFW